MEREEYNALETLRKRALNIGDAESYFNLCNEMGLHDVDIENPKLYDRGKQPELDFSGKNLEVAVIEERPITKPRERTAKDETYRGFLGRVENLHSNDYRGRREAMVDYFGRKFGPDGVTPVANMDDNQVWKVCEGLKKYGKRRLGRD
tara:strand:- start:1339 stop:1782 length:444 start_codon:yes stop_codon:yes gene_type:complete